MYTERDEKHDKCVLHDVWNNKNGSRRKTKYKKKVWHVTTAKDSTRSNTGDSATSEFSRSNFTHFINARAVNMYVCVFSRI